MVYVAGMERSLPNKPLAPGPEARSPANDPRRARPTTTNTNEVNREPQRGPKSDQSAVTKRNDDTPSTSTPQSPIVNDDGVPPITDGHSGLRDAFLDSVTTTVDVNFIGRKHVYLEQELKARAKEYNEAQKSGLKFPIVTEQALQARNQAEKESRAIKQEKNHAIEAQRRSSANFIDVLLTKIEEQSIDQSALLARVSSLEKQTIDRPALVARVASLEKQNAEQAALLGQVSHLQKDVEQLRSNLGNYNSASLELTEPVERKLNSFFDKKVNDIHRRVTTVSKATEPLYGLDRLVSRLRADHDDVRNNFQTQIDGLHRKHQASSTAASGDASKRVETVEADIHDLRQLIDGLDQKISQMQTQFRSDEDSHKMQQQSSGDLDKLKRTVHLRLENMNGELSDHKTAVKSSLESLSRDINALAGKANLIPSSDSVNNVDINGLKAEVAALNLAKQTTAQVLAALKTDQEKDSTVVKDLQIKVTKLDPSRAPLLREFAKQVSGEQIQPVSAEVSKLSRQLTALISTTEDMSQNFNARLKDRATDTTEIESRVEEGFKSLQDELALFMSTQRTAEENRGKVINHAYDVVKAEQLSQKAAIDKLQHILTGLNHRFNNLTTETLARQMTGVANKALVKFEKDLREVEGVVNNLQENSGQISTKIDSVNTTITDQFGEVRSGLKLNADNHALLTSNVEKEKALLEERIIALESLEVPAASQIKDLKTDDREVSKHTKEISDLTHEVNALRKKVTKLRSAKDRDQKDVTGSTQTSSVSSRKSSSHGSKGSPDVGNGEKHVKKLQKTPLSNAVPEVPELPRPITARPGDWDPSSDEEATDEIARNHLLNRFTGGRPSLQKPTTPSSIPQPPRPSSGHLMKRKRSGDNCEDSTSARQSKKATVVTK